MDGCRGGGKEIEENSLDEQTLSRTFLDDGVLVACNRQLELWRVDDACVGAADSSRHKLGGVLWVLARLEDGPSRS